MYVLMMMFQEELLAENMKKLEEMTLELEKSHKAEVEELRIRYEGKTL